MSPCHGTTHANSIKGSPSSFLLLLTLLRHVSASSPLDFQRCCWPQHSRTAASIRTLELPPSHVVMFIGAVDIISMLQVCSSLLRSWSCPIDEHTILVNCTSCSCKVVSERYPCENNYLQSKMHWESHKYFSQPSPECAVLVHDAATS